MPIPYAWTCHYCAGGNPPGTDTCAHCGKFGIASADDIARARNRMPPSREPGFLAFAAARRRELGGLSVAASAIVAALFVLEGVGLLSLGEPGGWLLIFAAWPWSIAATAIPNPIAPAILAVGVGINVALTAAIIWFAIVRWTAFLRTDPTSDP